MKNRAFLLTAATVAAATFVSLLFHHFAEGKARENEALWRQQDEQLAALVAENQMLSNRVYRLKDEGASTNGQSAELAELRAKAAALREQTSALEAQTAKDRRAAGTRFYTDGDYNLLEHNKERSMSMRGGPRSDDGKANDARVLTDALLKYAREHNGAFPSTFEPLTEYMPPPLGPDSPSWQNAPLSGTNHFEIVFQGTEDDLTNIPPRRVALIREEQPWQTADGKWARVYGYADGAAGMVESDDNFQSWDARHIVPARGAER